jgi:CyaY protein
MPETPQTMDESLFDRIADAELHAIEDALDGLDPDECEIENAAGVVTLSLADGSKLVVNSHRAARQIWMAAWLPGARQAWHFSPTAGEGGRWRWTVGEEELRAALGRILSQRLGRAIAL